MLDSARPAKERRKANEVWKVEQGWSHANDAYINAYHARHGETGKELFGLQLFSSSKDLNTVGDEFMVEYVVHGYNQNGRKRNLYEVEVN